MAKAQKKKEPEIVKEYTDRLNPQVADVEVGVRNLRKIQIYPLSVADQLATTDLITEAIAGFMRKDEMTDFSFVSFIVELIRQNIAKILTMATSEKGEELLQELSNMQAAEITEIVYDTNYGDVVKNFESLIEKVKQLFPSMRPYPQSLNGMEDIGLKTSTESPSETEELPTDKSSASSNEVKNENSKDSSS